MSEGVSPWRIAIGEHAGRDRVGESLRAPIVVENRPGAGGAIGVDAVVKAAPNGNTLLFVNSGPIVLVRSCNSPAGEA